MRPEAQAVGCDTITHPRCNRPQEAKAFGHAVMGVSGSTIERSLPVLAEGSQPDVLFRLGSFRMPVIASSSLGGSDGDPARRLVDGAGVAWGLDEGLDEHGRGVVALGPVPGRRRRRMARMCEPRLGISTHGRIRKRGLSTTSGRFFSRISGVHPMNLSRGRASRRRWRSRAWRAASRRGHGRRSASERRPGACSRGSGSGRRTRSRASLPGCAHDGAEVEGANLVEGRRRGEQRRLGVRSEDDGLGPALPAPRRRQGDDAIAVHGEHGHLRHHVLEAAVGLEPADTPAELSGQGGAGRLRIGGDQGAQQRHLVSGEVATVVAALDGAGHSGVMNSRLRSSLIVQGSQGDRSSGGLRHSSRRLRATPPASAGRRCRSRRGCRGPSTSSP